MIALSVKYSPYLNEKEDLSSTGTSNETDTTSLVSFVMSLIING
jgi:hypothetical protein